MNQRIGRTLAEMQELNAKALTEIAEFKVKQTKEYWENKCRECHATHDRGMSCEIGNGCEIK